jgi:hypothetical protein
MDEDLWRRKIIDSNEDGAYRASLGTNRKSIWRSLGNKMGTATVILRGILLRESCYYSSVFLFLYETGLGLIVRELSFFVLARPSCSPCVFKRYRTRRGFMYTVQVSSGSSSAGYCFLGRFRRTYANALNFGQ